MLIPNFMKDERTLGNLLSDRAGKYPDKVFGIITGEQITYAQLAERVNRMANALLDLGVKKGDNVSIMMSNCPEYIYTWFALGKIGAVEAVVNTAYKGDTLEYFLNYGGAEVIVLDADLVQRVQRIEGALKLVKTLVVRKVPVKSEVPQTKFKTIPFETVLHQASADEPVCQNPRYFDPVAIIYTSGTTGASKGVVYSHNYCYVTATNYIAALGLTEQDRVYSCLPLFHMNAQFLSVMATLVLGTTCAVVERFSLSAFWDDIRKYNATVFNFLGPMITLLWNKAEEDHDVENPARIALGVPVPTDLERPFQERFGLKLIQAFGATETGLVVTTPLDEPTPVGSCGKPLPGYDVRIVDEDDNEVPANVRGEFVFRPLNPFTMMSGYYQRPEATVEATRNLWYHYGDYGRQDENGFLYFIDRKKECMRRRGENVSASEVEAVVNRFPGVLESAASGVWSEMGEEDIKISIIPIKGKRIDPAELLKFCEQDLPWFALPRYVEFRDDFPRTPTGKTAKYLLKREGIHSNLWDREAAGYQVKKR